jgi:hypothetical protein
VATAPRVLLIHGPTAGTSVSKAHTNPVRRSTATIQPLALACGACPEVGPGSLLGHDGVQLPTALPDQSSKRDVPGDGFEPPYPRSQAGGAESSALCRFLAASNGAPDYQCVRPQPASPRPRVVEGIRTPQFPSAQRARERCPAIGRHHYHPNIGRWAAPTIAEFAGVSVLAVPSRNAAQRAVEQGGVEPPSRSPRPLESYS